MRAQLCLTHCDPMDCQAPLTMEFFFPGKNTRVGCHFLLQGIFPTQGSNPHLLYWQADSLSLYHLGIPLKTLVICIWRLTLLALFYWMLLLFVEFGVCFSCLVFLSGCWVWLCTHLCLEIWGYPVCETCDSLAYPRRLTTGQGWVVLVTVCAGGCPSGQGCLSALGSCPSSPLTATTSRHTTLTWPGLLRGHKESQVLQPLLLKCSNLCPDGCSGFLLPPSLASLSWNLPQSWFLLSQRLSPAWLVGCHLPCPSSSVNLCL